MQQSVGIIVKHLDYANSDIQSGIDVRMPFTSEQHGGFHDVNGEDESDKKGESGAHGFCNFTYVPWRGVYCHNLLCNLRDNPVQYYNALCWVMKGQKGKETSLPSSSRVLPS